MDALKVYDVKKICDARLCIVDMAAAFVRALATVLMMGGVAVLYRYRAVPAARLSSCSLHPRAAARPLAVRAASLRLGASARSPARPCRRPRALQPPACRRGATPPTQASPPPPDTAASRALHGRHKHTQALPPPSGTTASRALHGHHKHAHASSPPSGTAGTESGSHNKHPRARGPGVLICDRGAKTTCPRRSPCG